MKLIDKNIQRLDTFQRRNRLIAFTYAVIKKYGDDEAGYLAALLTYYTFLSIFPLLLVLTTLTAMLAGNHSSLQITVVNGVTNYFPVLGQQLSSHVSTLHKNGLALAVGILFTLYGTRGLADSFRRGVQKIWGVPAIQNGGFPASSFKSVGMVIVGACGLIIASVAASQTAAAGQGWPLRALSLLVNLVILFWLFTFLLNACLPKKVKLRDIRAGAWSSAIGLVILQTFGGFLLHHQLKHLDALYSNFAIALGLMFWIYLQAQVLFYSTEIAAVSAHHLWPRSLSGQNPTPAETKN